MTDQIYTTETPNASGFDALTHAFAEQFTISANRNVIGGRVWKHSTGYPTTFLWQLWRVSDVTLIAECDVTTIPDPDPGVAGWVPLTSADFVTPGDVAIVTTETYRVAVGVQGGDYVYRNPITPFAYPIVNGIVTADSGYFNNGLLFTVIPTTPDGTTLFFADVLLDVSGVDAVINATLPAMEAVMTATMTADTVIAATLPEITAAFTATMTVDAIINATLPEITAAFDAVSPVDAVLNATLPAVEASFTATMPLPPTPTGTGSLTVTVDTYFQLEAAAQHLLCWAGRPETIQVLHRAAGGPRLYIPETGFSIAPLIMKPGGVDILAGFVTGEHRLVNLGNAAATEVDPGTCAIGPIPEPVSVATRIGGNPAAITLTYTNAPLGAVNILWGDTTVDSGAPQAATLGHTYPGEGVYTITIQDADSMTDQAVFTIAVP